MLFLKPLIKTLIISSLLFFGLVFLGMKYHWVGFNQNDKDIELEIPEHTQVVGLKTKNDAVVKREEEDFQPQIIQMDRSSSLVSNMTKSQVTESCTQLLRNKMTDADFLKLAIGNCVISNYRDPIVETHLEEGTVKSTKSRQAQILKKNVLNICQQSLSTEKFSNEIERQLLLGICVSGKPK